jgi:hypothetical protein
MKLKEAWLLAQSNAALGALIYRLLRPVAHSFSSLPLALDAVPLASIPFPSSNKMPYSILGTNNRLNSSSF